MDRYIGIDAHSESSTIVVMGASGKRLRQQVVDTQAPVLIEFLRGVAGKKYVCIEEGQLAEWLLEALAPHVEEVAIVQPPEHNGRKSDLDDAWALASASECVPTARTCSNQRHSIELCERRFVLTLSR